MNTQSNTADQQKESQFPIQYPEINQLKTNLTRVRTNGQDREDQEIFQALTRVNTLVQTALSGSLEQALRTLVGIFKIEICEISCRVKITPQNASQKDVTANLWAQNHRISISFDTQKPLPRKHKIVLLRTAIRHCDLLMSILDKTDSKVEFFLDQCRVPENAIGSPSSRLIPDH